LIDLNKTVASNSKGNEYTIQNLLDIGIKNCLVQINNYLYLYNADSGNWLFTSDINKATNFNATSLDGVMNKILLALQDNDYNIEINSLVILPKNMIQ